MAIVPKALRFDYQSFNSRPGLTDVKGQVYVGGLPKAVGANALAFAEVDSTNAKGLYSLLITPAQLTSWGVAPGQENTVEVFTNSATWPGPTPIKAVAQVATADDIAALIGSPAGASVSADIKSVYDRIGAPSAASVSADILALNTQQQTILTQLQALANAATIAGGVSYVLPVNPITGANPNTYVIPITILDNDGDLVDPAGGVLVGLKNQAGVDRGGYLTGSAGSPATVQATKVSTGQYQVTLVIPAGAPQEELIASFAYTILGKPQLRYGVMGVRSDDSVDAQQQTLLDVQAAVKSINDYVKDSGFGLQALKNFLSDATYGLPSIKALITDQVFGLPVIQAMLSNSQYGLAQLATSLNNANTALGELKTQLTSAMGAAFDTSKHSLVALRAAIDAIPVSGGRGV